jgi:HSP20 family molecular chaperone IbpA
MNHLLTTHNKSKLPFHMDEGGNIVFTRSMPPVLHHSRENEQDDASLKCQITELDDSFHLAIDIPGVKKKDLHVEVREGILEITGIRHFIGDFPDKSYKKVFRLDANVIDASHLTANLSDGVLVVSAPKVKNTTCQVIPITQHSHQAIGGNAHSSSEKKETPSVEIHHGNAAQGKDKTPSVAPID